MRYSINSKKQSIFLLYFLIYLIFIPQDVDGGGCKTSFYPIVVGGKDKGDTKIFSFDYNIAAPRFVIGGETSDKDFRTYDVADKTPLLI